MKEKIIRKEFKPSGAIYYYFDGQISKLDGYAIIKCYWCNGINHFFINGSEFLPNEFAEKTNHIICNICYDFCKQSCFV